jgi:hypothetical protein
MENPSLGSVSSFSKSDEKYLFIIRMLQARFYCRVYFSRIDMNTADDQQQEIRAQILLKIYMTLDDADKVNMMSDVHRLLECREAPPEQ